MNECIFCKIANKEIKAKVVHETGRLVCFLDINPISWGHCLIVPKKHFADIFEIDAGILEEVAVLAKKISAQARIKLGAKGVNILHASGKDAQQSVFHFHIHLVPRYENDGLDTWPKSSYKESSLNGVLKKLLL